MTLRPYLLLAAALFVGGTAWASGPAAAATLSRQIRAGTIWNFSFPSEEKVEGAVSTYSSRVERLAVPSGCTARAGSPGEVA